MDYNYFFQLVFGLWLLYFFILFGSYVLVEITSSLFLPMLLILEIGTAIALYVVLGFYQKIDSSRYAAIKLGDFWNGNWFVSRFLSFILCFDALSATITTANDFFHNLDGFCICTVFIYTCLDGAKTDKRAILSG